MTEEQQGTTSQEETTAQVQEATEEHATGASQTQQTTADQESKTYDEDYVKNLRSEAAGYRTELRKLQNAQKQRDDVEKSELEKLTEERDGLAKERETWQRERTANAFRLQINLPSPGLALGAARELGVEVELDEKGSVKNLDAIRKQLKAQYPREFGDGSADGAETGGGNRQSNDMNSEIRRAAGR